MPELGKKSKDQLATCHPLLQKLFNEVIKHYDFVVLEGHRNQADQDKAFAEGKSKLKWPNGNHNKFPSEAVDAAPYPIDWNDTKRFYYFAGLVKGIAISMGIDIRWGGDWDSDNDFKDQTFNDLPHFELRLGSSAGKPVVSAPAPTTSFLPDVPSEADMNKVLEDIERNTLKKK